MKIYPVIRKVIQSSAGFIASVVYPGVQQTLRVSITALQHRVGVLADATRQALRIDCKPAMAITLLPVTGTAAQVPVNPGISATARISEFHVDEIPAFDIKQVVYNLLRRVGGNAQTAVGTAWTNPANAISGTDGIHDGSNATAAGSALGGSYGIQLDYANSVNKAELAITSAKLAFYAQAAGDLGGLLVSTVLSYNIGAGWVTLETIAGNFSNLGAPREYIVPINTWAKFDALQTRVVSTFAAASLTASAALDAVEVEINATKTDNL